MSTIVKYIFIIFMLFGAKILQSQAFTSIDEKYWFYEFLNDSTTKIYYSEIGVPTPKACAYYYRIARIDRHYLMFTGEVKDYYIDSTPAFKGHFSSNGYLNGIAEYYYPNGKLMEQGIYKVGRRDSIWTYYYPNGHLQKVIEFDHNKARLLEFYSKSGKPKVTNGNGKYKDYLRLSHLSDYKTLVQGTIKDGYFDGKWKATNSVFGSLDGVEYFQNGMFIKGESKEWDEDVPYTDNARTSLSEFVPQENLNFYIFSINCPGYSVNPARYKEPYTLSGVFYPELVSKIEQRINVKNTENQWFIITFKVNEEMQLNSLQIKSSLDDQALKQDLIKLMNHFTDWTKAGILNGKVINFPFFITIVFEDGSLIIPDFHLNM